MVEFLGNFLFIATTKIIPIFDKIENKKCEGCYLDLMVILGLVRLTVVQKSSAWLEIPVGARNRGKNGTFF